MAVNPSSAFAASPDARGGSLGGLTLVVGVKLELGRLFAQSPVSLRGDLLLIAHEKMVGLNTAALDGLL